MSRFAWSALIWGPWVAYFVVFEVWANWFHARWLTLSGTVDDVERWWWPIQFVILIGLAILMVHWFAGGPIQLAAHHARRIVGR